MEFLFTKENRLLRDMEEEWLAERKFGAYMLIGKSGSGKTTFLRQLDADWQNQRNRKMITWMTTEYVIDSFLHGRDIFKELQTPIVIMENMEDLAGRDSTLTCIFDLLYNWLKQGKRLFIGTSANSNIPIPEYVTILENREIEITPGIVERIAKTKNIRLDRQCIDLLCREAEGRMASLLGILHREMLAGRI